MNRSVIVIFAAMIWLAAPASVRAQAADPATEADIAKLMEVTGSAKMADQFVNLVLQQMTATVRTMSPDVPPRALEIVRDVVTTKLTDRMHTPDGLISKIVPVYTAHFTHDDIRGLLAFYQTDLGKKLIATMPAVVAESAAIGQSWVMALLPEIQSEMERRLRAEGLVVK